MSSLATNEGTDGEFKIDGIDEFPQMLTCANPLRAPFGFKFLVNLKADEMEFDAEFTF